MMPMAMSSECLEELLAAINSIVSSSSSTKSMMSSTWSGGGGVKVSDCSRGLIGSG